MTQMHYMQCHRPGHAAGLLQPLQAELANSADALSCSVALEFVEELAQGGPGAARALCHALGAQLTPLLVVQDIFLRCQAIRVGLGPQQQAAFTSRMPICSGLSVHVSKLKMSVNMSVSSYLLHASNHLGKF